MYAVGAARHPQPRVTGVAHRLLRWTTMMEPHATRIEGLPYVVFILH